MSIFSNKELSDCVHRNLNWFTNSQIMRPADGFWGVAERLLLIYNKVTEETLECPSFPCQTRIRPDLAVLEHRRADCVLETAWLFAMAADYFDDEQYKTITANLVDFFFNRANLEQRNEDKTPTGLYRWGMQSFPECWTDDNSWVCTMLLLLSANGYPEAREPALRLAEKMYCHMKHYLDVLEEKGRDYNFTPEWTMNGSFLNPHWLGLTAMAFSHAYVAQKDEKYRKIVHNIFRIMPGGPPSWSNCRLADGSDDWSVSEYAYWTLEAAIAYAAFRDPELEDSAHFAACKLLASASDYGSFISNHFEAPAGKEFADLIYTHNWALLGLYHMAKLFPENEKYKTAFEKTMRLTLDIQDTSSDTAFAGCWRGMYDCKNKCWGGGDSVEGGAGSIYSGWTNAPIAWVPMFMLNGKSLIPAL